MNANAFEVESSGRSDKSTFLSSPGRSFDFAQDGGLRVITSWLIAMLLAFPALAQTTIQIDPTHVLKPISRYLTGACIEDVNHEIYGGLYSQMIFGESFQEPSSQPVEGFSALGGEWSVQDGALKGAASQGGKLVFKQELGLSDFGVEIYFPNDHAGNAGMILNVKNAGIGADRFDGLEVSLDPNAKILRVARHRQDYRLVTEVPCNVATRKWIRLEISVQDDKTIFRVDGKQVASLELSGEFDIGAFGVRTWQRPAEFKNYRYGNGEKTGSGNFLPAAENVSGMWTKFQRSDAVGAASLTHTLPFQGSQSQTLTFSSGTGEIGIENRGLNHQAMNLLKSKPYLGHLWTRAATPTKILVSFNSGDGKARYANDTLQVNDTEWHRYDFTLTPDTTDAAGRFEISLNAPGSIDIGYVFLEPGPWGTFKGLPVRADVAQGLIDQGITAMRYGGSMVNNDGYRWKKMIGDRDHRPPYHGLWYHESTNGWGIPDFLNFCEAAHFLPVVDFNINESPADMVDFLEYANGPAKSSWGAKRAADGHPLPYQLTHIELGNEERVDEKYFKKFDALAKAIWAQDHKMILTVGDFTYHQPITDPMHIKGADSRIDSLAAHQQILALAKQFDAEVWFDIHVWTEGLTHDHWNDPFLTYVDAIDKLADGAKHHVVVFELNANNHQQQRALANALALLRIEKDGRLPFVSSANCLQVDHQNDNGWDQGLLFLNPTQVWLQPPGYAWQMFSRAYQPNLVECAVTNGPDTLEVAATVSDDGKTLILQAVNTGDAPAWFDISIKGWNLSESHPVEQTLSAPLTAANSAENPLDVRPTDPKASINSVDKYILPVEPTQHSGQDAFSPHSISIRRWTKPN